MKPALAAVTLGTMVAAAGFAPTGALAATELDVGAFTIRYVNGANPANWNINLVTQTPLTTVFSLDELNADLGYWPAEDWVGEGTVAGGGHHSVLEIAVAPGYRVTGVTVHAIAYGELNPGWVPDHPTGIAENRAHLAWSMNAPGAPQPFSVDYENFLSLNPIALGGNAVAIDGTFQVDIAGTVWARAVGVNADGAYTQSTALASIGNALLLVQVAAIPEPATWSMLAGGLALLVSARWRARLRDKLQIYQD